jgi:hypothetical protein
MAIGSSCGRRAAVATGGEVEGSPWALGDVCEELDEVHPEPRARLPKVVLPKGASGCCG